MIHLHFGIGYSGHHTKKKGAFQLAAASLIFRGGRPDPEASPLRFTPPGGARVPFRSGGLPPGSRSSPFSLLMQIDPSWFFERKNLGKIQSVWAWAAVEISDKDERNFKIILRRKADEGK
jgi:hypothetical protein